MMNLFLTNVITILVFLLNRAYGKMNVYVFAALGVVILVDMIFIKGFIRAMKEVKRNWGW